MAVYAYSALNNQGQHVTGSITATSRDEAIVNLRKQGSRPLTVKEAKRTNYNLSFGGRKVKSKDLVVFTRQLSTMVSAGVTLPRTLATLAGQAENKYFKEVITGINHDVESGAPLADAMSKFPNVFNDVYINMVRAGESGGLLDEILKRLAHQEEKDAAIKAKVKSAMTYPLVLLTITIIAFFVLMTYVVPKIGSIVENLGGPGTKLPAQTRLLLGISHALTSKSIVPVLPNALFIIIVIIAVIFYLRRYTKTPKGRFIFHTLLLRIPLFKIIITKVAIARFSRTFASLMGAGVTVLESLQVTSHALGNAVIEQELLKATGEIREGRQLSQALSKSELFPPIVSQMLAVGEETGKTDEVLTKVADFYEEEVDAVIASLSSILEPVMIVILGSMVGFIAVSVLGPITSLNQTLQKSQN